MKKSKKRVIIYSVFALLIVLSAVFAILSGLVKGMMFWIPILNFFLFLLLGSSIIYYVLGFVFKKAFNFFLACVFIIPCILYSFIMFALPWWVIVIACIAIPALTALLSYIVAGNGTESISKNSDD